MKKVDIYNQNEIEILQAGGKRLRAILEFLGKECKPGNTGLKIDMLAEKKILENEDIPVFKNYKPDGAEIPFPATICISINNVAAHGLPDNTPFVAGDIVSLDLGFRHAGLVVDSAISIIVGEEINDKGESNFPNERKLLNVAKKALEIGIKECLVGKQVNDVGIAVEEYVVSEGFNVIDILCGHAVGREIHSDPQIPHANYGRGGAHFREGMVVAIEPHISEASGEIFLDNDKWSYKTKDNSKTAQFEHTIFISKDGPIILT